MARLKWTLKSTLARLGFEVSLARKSPRSTLCGLSVLPVQTVVDVGANTGQFAKDISRIFPGSDLICFEPLPQAYEKLSAWAGLHKHRVETLNIALGDKEGTVEMFFHREFSPASSLLPSTSVAEVYFPLIKDKVSIPVKITTLDNALEDRLPRMRPEILVKLDVQGYEEKVLAGGHRTLDGALACILEISLDTLYEGQADFANLVSMLSDLGFRFGGTIEQICDRDGHVIFLDALFVKKDRTLWKGTTLD